MRQHNNQCTDIMYAVTRFDGVTHQYTPKILTTCSCWCHKK